MSRHFSMLAIPCILCLASLGHGQVTMRPTVEQSRATLRQTDDDQLRREAVRHLQNHGLQAKPAIPELVALFAVPDEELRLNAALLLATFGADAMPDVIKQLQAKDAHARYYALATLTWMGKDASKATDAIVRSLGDPSALVRLKAIHAAGVLDNDLQAIKALVAILKDKDAEMRGAALESLKKIAAKAGIVHELYPFMSDPDRALALTALKAVIDLDQSAKTLEAILQLTDKGDGSNVAQSDEARRAVVRHGAEAVDKLMAILERNKHAKGNMYATFNASIMLGLIGSRADKAAPLMQEMLLADNIHSHGVVYGLTELGKRQILADALRNEELSANLRALCATVQDRFGIDAIPTLVHAAASKAPEVRRAALTALGNISLADKRTMKTLTAALADDDEHVRRYAVFALQRIGKPGAVSKEVVDAVKLVLLDVSDDNINAAHGLLDNLGVNVHASLTEFLDSKDDRLRLTAAARLLVMPPPMGSKWGRELDMAVAGLKHKDATLGMRCALALARGQHKSAREKLLPFFRASAKHADAQVRLQAIQLLAYCSDSSKDVLKDFVPLLDDKDVNVRWTAVANMYNVGFDFAKALPHYEKGIKDTPFQRDYLVGLAAMHGKEKAMPLLRTALKDDVTCVRALQALAGMDAAKVRAEFTPELRAALKEKQARMSALAVLVNLRDGKGFGDFVSELRDLLTEGDDASRSIAVGLLAETKPAGLTALSKHFDATPRAAHRARIAVSFAGLGVGEMIDKAMKDPVPAVRESVLTGLDTGKKDSEKYLIGGMHDPNPDVRRVAATAFATGMNAGRLAILEDMLKQKKPGARESALIAWPQSRDFLKKAHVQGFTACLSDPSAEVRALAVRLLLRLGPDAQDAWPTLRKTAADDIDDNVREAARSVVQ